MVTTRAEYRRDFSDRLLPRISEAAEAAEFIPVRRPGRPYAWVRLAAEGVRAEVVLREMTGRQVRDGLDLQAHGALFLDEVERCLRAAGARHPEAATLTAPLRSWGSTFTRDARYPLRWNTDPEGRIDQLIGDLRSFARFARTVSGVADLSAERLARSRIRRHVASGLAPHYAVAAVADIIRDLNDPSGEHPRPAPASP